MDGVVRKIRPFSNGTQYMDWEASNCARCVHAATKEQYESAIFPCDIEKELAFAAVDDGKITDDAAKRMAYAPGKFIWQCGEWEPTDDWKAEVEFRKRQLNLDLGDKNGR